MLKKSGFCFLASVAVILLISELNETSKITLFMIECVNFSTLELEAPFT